MLTVKQLQQRNVFEVIIRKSILQEMADFSVYPGDSNLETGEMVQNLEAPGLSRRVDSPVVYRG